MKTVLVLTVATLIFISLLPVEHATNPPFANPAFQRLWLLQSAAAATPIDLWGSEPLLWRLEPYADASDSRRIVQYFDRGRMELSPDPNAGNQLVVTQGLLAQEMTTGAIQLGDTLTERRDPPPFPVDGGPADDQVATYQALGTVVTGRAVDYTRGGELPSLWLGSAGPPRAAPGAEPLRAGDYVALTGHNLPSVFVSFFNRQPFGPTSWVEALGYPLSEPYWTMYRRQGMPLPSLIQVFQRRILVYTPSLPEAQRFTVANTGRDYYRWRYDQEPGRTWPDPRPGLPDTRITVPAGFEAGIYAQGLGNPVGVANGPDGRIWIVTEQGDVARVDSEHPDGSADHVTVIARGLANPRGIAIAGDSAYVAVDDGVVVLPSIGDGSATAPPSYATKAIEPAPGSRGAPSVEAGGIVYVAGTPVPSAREKVVLQAGPGAPDAPALAGFVDPGPVMAAHGQIYVVDRLRNGEARLLLLGLRQSALANRDRMGASAQQTVARFPAGTTVNSVILFDSAFWPQVSPDTLFASVSRGDSGSVLRAVPRDDGTPPELVEFATGFTRPAGIAVGLDGSLYVADPGKGEVIKIIARPQR